MPVATFLRVLLLTLACASLAQAQSAGAALLQTSPEAREPARNEAQAETVASKSVTPPTRFALENGLTVVLERDTRCPRIAIAVTYRVGSRDDPPGYRGLAHLVEHLMFEGMAKSRGGDYFEQLERIGATKVNGLTSSDSTVYAQELPTSHLELGLWLEASRMAYVLSWLDAASVERARAAVLNEWEQNVGGDPFAGLHAHQLRALYPDSHPYHEPHDKPEDVEAIALSDAQWFLQDWYRPNNANLTLVGNFDEAEARTHIERLFGPIRTTGKLRPRAQATAVQLTGEHVLDVAWQGDSQMGSLLWPVAPATGQEGRALEVLSLHLTRVLNRMAVDQGNFESASVAYDETELGGALRMWWAMDEESDAERALAQVQQAIARVRTELLTDAELTRARDLFRRTRLFARESLTERVLDRAFNLDRAELDSFDGLAAAYASVSAEDVRSVARRWLVDDRRIRAHAHHRDNAPRTGRVRRHRIVEAKEKR